MNLLQETLTINPFTSNEKILPTEDLSENNIHDGLQ